MSRKPTEVKIVVALLYAALSLTLIQATANVLSMGGPNALAVVIFGVSAVLTVFLIEFISIGRNWARVVYFGMTLLSLPIAFFFFRQQWAEISLLHLVSLGLQIACHAVAAYLCFLSRGKVWFRPSRSSL